jgi:hypothetical protein
MPELCKFAFSLAFSTAMDYLIHKEYLSITAVRKISVATSKLTKILIYGRQMQGFFSLHYCIHISFGTHPVSYPLGIENSGSKAAGA